MKNIETIRHSMSHIMAAAVKEMYPDVKFAIGPAIENGFYYDFDVDVPFAEKDLAEIEKKMKKIINSSVEFKHSEVSKEEAKEMFKGQPYKLEIIDGIEDDKVSIYQSGDFVDLCAGPHIDNTNEIQNCAFKLTRVSGAYWRGDSSKKMLQRIYAVAFENKKELAEHLERMREAESRDHNKLGRTLEFFTTVDYIGQGLPILLPRGAKVIQILQRFVEDEEFKRGWLLTKTPFMAKNDLYKISGHWDHYKDGMFVLGDEEKDKEVFALRPMTCPFQYQAYLNKMRSYKDLPLRYNETSTLFRNESSGEMHGLIRVRQFTISEGHLMCTPEQLEQEFRSCVELATYMLKTLGLYEDASYRFSQWDPENREKYIGTEEQWNEAQGVMEKILNNLGIEYEIGVGEAAFYGPKLDIQIKNVWGKEDTLITIQIDQLLAEKFGMLYTDKDGERKNPYIIHRTSIGCYERTLAYLIEKYAGALPFWISPTQVAIVPVTENHNEYAHKIAEDLRSQGIRVEVDTSDNSMGKKVGGFRTYKTPYILILGDKEQTENTVSMKIRGGKQVNDIPVNTFVESMRKLDQDKNISLVEEF